MEREDVQNGERRASLRIPICVAIGLEWRTPAEDIRRTRGVTCDLSRSGVYAFVHQPFVVDLRTEFDIAFPGELTDDLPRRFLCQGRVARCESIRGLFGVGIAIKARQFIEDRKLHRRSYTRITPSAILTADMVGYWETGKVVRDITRAGAFIEVSHPLPAGQEVELVLRERDLPSVFKVTAVVRRSEPAVGMGVEFIEVSKEADHLLRRCTGTSLSLS